jgi:hypothetical protein
VSAKFVWTHSGFAGKLEDRTKKLTLAIAEKVFNGVVSRTPVRTGSARASWVASVGEPLYVYRNGGDVASPISPPSFTLKSIPPYQKLYIANGAPYIEQLEFGSSSQAPQGMLRVTLTSLGIMGV